jgi:signal transduction histidine kinase
LLSNAIKYSPERARILVNLRFDPERLAIIVKDEGIGIPKEELEHLFERFFRASNTSGISGTGLGLSIVKKYLDLTGGNILITSYIEAGSEFTVLLPCTPIHE